MIYQPVFVPFLTSRAMTLTDIGILMAVYNIGVLVLDIPTGFVADRFGRKWALAGANLALAIGTAIIAFGHSLGEFIVAELFYSLAIALDAGTHSAYLFEWLRQNKKESQYYRYDAYGIFILLLASTIGTFVGGIYAEHSLVTPVLLTIGLTAIGVPAACLLPESRSSSDSHESTSGEKAEQNVGPVTILNDILSNRGLLWAVGVAVIWFWSRQYINLFISQPYFKSIHLHYRDYGKLYSVMTLAGGLIAFFSRRFIQSPDLRGITLFGLILIPVTFGTMGLAPGKLGLLGFFIFSIPFGLCTPITNTLLNRQFTRHESRATFLSVVDTCTRLVAAVLAIVLGRVLDMAGPEKGPSQALTAAMLISGAFAVVLLPGLFKFARSQKTH